MKTKTFASILIALSMLCLASCSNKAAEAKAANEVKADDAKMGAARPGGLAVETMTIIATVQSIDAAHRTVTLMGPEGNVVTVKCGKEVINFDQIKLGDHVKVKATEELALYVRKAGDPPNAAATGMVALAPKGAKPGMLVTDTGEITARVQLVDAANHKVTLIGPEGNVRVFHVDPSVNLDGVRIGDDVVAQFARSLAITVETPR